MKKTFAAIATALLLTASPVLAATDAPTPPDMQWPHHGVFSTYDKAALQRGFQVFKEVCAACHALDHMHYRNLSGLGYSDAQIKALAAEYTVMDGPNDDGDMFERQARPADKFVKPFANDKAARAVNNGAMPPDLSLIIKARHNGEDYLYALLTGYEDVPEGEEMLPGQYYNKYFPGHKLSMAPPLVDGLVTYSDGTSASLEQASRDVTQFLAWASEPYQDERKQMGVKVILYLLIFAGILYAVKKKVWSDVH
ncbi:MAG: cytochrome c1 [Alphaproteobacteria bacterium]|nr:cytochrome c1 [Alphaproteobacteria bacterium]